MVVGAFCFFVSHPPAVLIIKMRSSLLLCFGFLFVSLSGWERRMRGRREGRVGAKRERREVEEVEERKKKAAKKSFSLCFSLPSSFLSSLFHQTQLHHHEDGPRSGRRPRGRGPAGWRR